MLIGKIHPGSGLGDQLFSYITTRTIALDKGYDFGFVGKEFFKGKDFMNLDWGKDYGTKYHIEQPSGELITDHVPFSLKESTVWKFVTPHHDPEVNFIEDGTVIDGCSAQDERYWGHRLDEIREWLRVEPLEMPDDLCVINFRGGEYATVPELFLTKDYWNKAVKEICVLNPGVRFEVHTDDIATAQSILGNIIEERYDGKSYIKDIAFNWRSVRYAKHLILSNSAFGILPALLNENVKEVIAPFGWNARNKSLTKWLGRPMNYYKKFLYI